MPTGSLGFLIQTLNLGLATTVASLVDAVRSKMKLDFTHVRSVRGIHGNEIADRLAKRGANSHLTAWLGFPPHPPPPAPEPKPRARAAAMHVCPKCQKDFIWGAFIIQILVEAQATQT